MILWNDIALLEDDSHFSTWVKEAGRLDHHQGFLKQLKPYIKGTVLDIGANIGTHTHFYTQYANEVLAFEPNPKVLECLKHNCPKATILHCAVSDHSGYISMADCGPNYGAAYTVPGNQIPCITIDMLALPRCDYMKIDVEGDELAVLLGAKETIRRHKPVMCIECNEHTLVRKGLTGEMLVRYIRSIGYTCTDHNPKDVCTDLICLPVHS